MKNRMLEDKIEVIHRYRDFLRQRYKVKKMGIFGSTVRNQRNKNSDLDVLVEFSSPIGFFQFIDLESFLSRILRQKVDLVSKKALKPAIKPTVLSEVVYA